MFPPPPEAPPPLPIPPGPTLQWSTVPTEEIASAIQTSAPNRVPGTDGMSFLLPQKANLTAPQLFNTLYPHLIEYGYHALCWR